MWFFSDFYEMLPSIRATVDQEALIAAGWSSTEVKKQVGDKTITETVLTSPDGNSVVKLVNQVITKKPETAEELQTNLDAAVASQNYELAAKLHSKLKQLQQTNQTPR